MLEKFYFTIDRSILAAFFVACFLCSVIARAEGESDEYEAHLGTLLPNQITGVTEVLPVFGFRYSLPVYGVVQAETNFENSHAQGVDFTTLSVNARIDFEIAQQLMGVAYIGPDLSYYSPVNSGQSTAIVGLDAGGAVMAPLFSHIWLRGDLRLSLQPGANLYLGVGLAYRPADAR